MSKDHHEASFERPRVLVGVSDVLVLTVPQTMRTDEKQQYLEWFRQSLEGTSLSDCRIILLDGGADVGVYRGPSQ